MFECDKCGLCCIGLDQNETTAYLHDGDGICRHLNQETMLCEIYEERPIFCRVEEYYDKYLAEQMSKEEFMKMNYEACLLKKEEFARCGGDIHKMACKVPELEAEQEAVLRESLERMSTEEVPTEEKE